MTLVILFCGAGIAWAIRNVRKVTNIDVMRESDIDLDEGDSISYDTITPSQKRLLLELGEKIKDVLILIFQGAKEFLKQEYFICMIFVGVMYFVIAFLTPEAYYTATAFLIGAVVSIICGAIGMTIATSANYRTTYAAKRNLPLAFKTAYRAGVAMGFALVSLGLLSNPSVIKS